MMTRLFELLAEFKNALMFWVVIDQFEKGLLMRLGIAKRELDPGLHWLWPFIDVVLIENVVLTTAQMDPQSLTTKDDVGIVLASVITYYIVGLTKFLTRVEDADSAVMDVTYGMVNEYVRTHTWKQVRSLKFQQELFGEIYIKALHFGILIDAFSFSDMTKAKVIRLIQDLQPVAELDE